MEEPTYSRLRPPNKPLKIHKKYDQSFQWHVSASLTECTRMCQTFLSALGSWDSHKTMSLIKLRHFVLTVATIRICACIIWDWRTGKIWKWGNKYGTGLQERTPSLAHCSRRIKNWTLNGFLYVSLLSVSVYSISQCIVHLLAACTLCRHHSDHLYCFTKTQGEHKAQPSLGNVDPSKSLYTKVLTSPCCGQSLNVEGYESTKRRTDVMEGGRLTP